MKKIEKKTLAEWLIYNQSLHIKEMDLSLERVEIVASRLDLLAPTSLVITVAGTNGKGSCVAGLEFIYLAAGYRTGAFTSPALFRHNEQVRILGKEVEDQIFCLAFEKVEAARGDMALTFFEFNTLAALVMFKEAQLDVCLLEVGLGGRWDAVNVINADVAIISSIGIDHVEFLGDTREKIAIEKAGIFRRNQFAVCGDIDPPSTLMECAKKTGVHLYCQNQQFGFVKKAANWDWWSEKNRFVDLPLTKLALQNMATVLMAIELLQEKLPVSRADIDMALASVTLSGRIQVFSGEITRIFDVSHNPASAGFLANWLTENMTSGKTRAVFSMLADKDIFETIQVIRKYIDKWYVAPLSCKRAASMETLLACFQKADISVCQFIEIEEAYQAVLEESCGGDRIIVFGSFHTVAEVAKHDNLS